MNAKHRRRRRATKFSFNKVRTQILDAANAHLSRNPNTYRTLTGRHMQEAVCIVRHNMLVSDETLRIAGYNPVPTRPALRPCPWGGRSSYTPKKVRRYVR